MQNHPAFASPLNRRILIDIIAMLLIGLVTVVGYKLSPLLSPKADTRLQPKPGCNLHRGACNVALDDGELEISISPRPIPLVKPIAIEVRSTGAEIKRIDADFAGIGMNMGYNRPQLVAVGENRYRAETTLPVCITGTMDWELTLMVETGTKHVLIPIRFTTPEGGLGS
jgi:hypothetical protein